MQFVRLPLITYIHDGVDESLDTELFLDKVRVKDDRPCCPQTRNHDLAPCQRLAGVERPLR